MTINATDIKLLESERMSDASDGGGRRTSHIIPDGVTGNVFPKVSRVDSVYGRVNLRKVYGHVATANLDMYAGAHFIVTDAPDNGRIHVTAFSTASDFDTRVAARDRIESYVIAGPMSRMTLYGRQLLGSQAVLVYQRTTEPLPEIGDVYALSNEVGDTTINQQFVRIQDVAGEVRIFTDEGGDFTVLVVTLKIGAPLRYEFYGPATPQRISGTSTTGRVRSTTVADAARYFGIQPLAEAATTGALELTVSSVYAPLVPTTQRETPLSLASIAGAENLVPGSLSYTPWVIVDQEYYNGVKIISLPRSVVPGKLKLLISSGASVGDSPYEQEIEVGLDGNIPPFGIDSHLTVLGGNANFQTGRLTINVKSVYVGTMFASYIPAAEVAQPAHTLAIPITLGTRGTVYAIPLLPIPTPGTLLLDYRALGKWYRLRDEGNGELVGGDVQYGTGTIDYVNGAATVTLGALPDVGSSIILSWGSPVHYEIHTADTGAGPFQEFTLSNLPIKAGSFTCAFLANGVTYNITSDAAGVLSGGGATGAVDHLTGAVRINYATRLPDFDSTLTIGYTSFAIDPVQPNPPAPGSVLVKSASLPSVAGDSTISVGEAVQPGALRGSVHVAIGSLVFDLLIEARADGLVYTVGQTAGGSISLAPLLIVPGQPVGTFAADTGTVTLSSGVSFFFKNYDGAWSTVTLTGVPITAAGGTHSLGYGPLVLNGLGAPVATIDTPRTATLAVDTDARIKLDLTRTSTSAVVPGSVMFDAAGKTFVDRNGTLYSDLLPNGSGTAAGSLDYATGIATLAFWARGAELSLSVNACLIKYGDWTATDVFFRTAGSPLRPASTYVQVTAADGELLSGTSDQNGNITGAGMVGKIEQTVGVASIRFGNVVTAAGSELEPWYDAANVVGGMIFKPREVMPGTLRYSAVVLSNLPLNADILGLDPTRLPSDGRAPIYRPADVVVIHHTGAVDAGTPSAGTILDAGRTGLSTAWVEDSAKVKLDPALYTVDLAAGTVTMATPLDLAAYTPPLTMRHRIEEMGLLSDVQINGQVSLTAPLLRDYPLGSQLSSALLFGDLQARVTHVFEQQTWTGEWADALIGDAPAAQYDDVNYPIETLNDGSLTERWRIQFTGGTAFQVIGQNLGVIATGSTSADLQPINTLTGLPYFTLRKNGWGMGWSTGNQLRFDTIGAVAPIWLARTVLPGATLEGDSFDAQLRGDVD